MATTWQRVRRAQSRLSTEAVQRMDALPWFTALSPSQRADVGLVVQAGPVPQERWGGAGAAGQTALIAETSNSRVILSLTSTPPVSSAAFQVMP